MQALRGLRRGWRLRGRCLTAKRLEPVGFQRLGELRAVLGRARGDVDLEGSELGRDATNQELRNLVREAGGKLRPDELVANA